MHVKISNGLNSVFHKIQDYASLLPSPIASILSSVSRHSIQSVVGRGRTETVSSLENLFVRPRPLSHSALTVSGQETVDIRQKFVFGQKEIAPRKTRILSLPPSFGSVADRS